MTAAIAVTAPAAGMGDFLAALTKAAADLKANRPLPPRTPMTGADAAAMLKVVQAKLPPIIAWLDAHPGVITAGGDILDVLAARGFSLAKLLEEILEAGPSSLQTAEDVIPWIVPMLTMFAPAATGIVGDGPTNGGFRVGRG